LPHGRQHEARALVLLNPPGLIASDALRILPRAAHDDALPHASSINLAVRTPYEKR
jgi:hypothetical protein